jgi:hypothetical protein
MEFTIRKLVSIGVFVIVVGAVSAAFGQDLSGGYVDADVADKEVKAAAAFAVRRLGMDEAATIRLVAIEAARLQVVAGLNYELCMEVSVRRGAKKGAKRYVKAVVYRDLKNRLELTRWSLSMDPPNCGDSK